MAEKEIKIVWDEDKLFGDFVFENGDLTNDEGLTSAVIISLFTDARASVEDRLPDIDNINLRGWWGDVVSSEVEGDKIGSLLWLLEREKTTDNVLISARRYCENALAWMIEDGVAATVEVNVEREKNAPSDRLNIYVKIYKKDKSVVSIVFNDKWEEMS